MKSKRLFQFILLHLFSLSILLTSAQQVPWFNTEPTLNFDVHDPCIIKDEEGRYTMMSTNNLLTLRQSTDLISWTNAGRVFNAVPAWAQQQIPGVQNLWAPHLVYMGGKYYAYYSASSFGSNDSGIGCASTATLNTNDPNYGWTDHGMVILSEGQNFNAIDPEIIQDESGSWWMVFGSFWQTGIRMVQINPNTGKRTSENNTIYALADRNGGAIEGPSLIYHDGYYYLFVAYDACCAGLESTYRTMVGRAQNITGPYLDKNGTDMRNNAASEVLSGYNRYYGTGHGSVFKDNRRDYFVHHYYDGNSNGFPRPHIREIVWGTDGWPTIDQPFIGRRQAYEAEHGALINTVVNTGNNASDGSYVGNINFADSRVNFRVNALQTGAYTVHIRYAAGAGNASHLLAVNGNEQEVQYPATANWGQFPQGQSVKVRVQLNEGYNLLSFRPGTGFAELDRIDLYKPTSARIEAGNYDNGLGITHLVSGNNVSMAPGSWSQMEYVDFEAGGKSSLTIKAGGSCNGTLKFAIDNINGSTNATATVNLTNSQTYPLSLPTTFSTLTGAHDVYLSYSGSNACVLDDILFASTTPEEDCNGVVGGSAYLDNCSVCVGGNTGLTPCEPQTSGNPIITERFSADPAALIHGDKVYLYAGRDEAPANSTDFVLNRWDVYSTCDMVNWTHEGSPLSIDDFDWAWAAAFAGQCVEKDGRFYWYVPMLGSNNQGAGPYFSIGVAVADSPTGPFEDALGEPLIFDNTTPDVWFDIDPSVFVDDDGQAYIYWGNVTQGDQAQLSPMKMAKLNDDMISIEQGSIRTVTLGNGNPLPGWVEAPYMHKKGDIYYLSYARYYPEQIVYCTGPSPEGPWTFRGLLNDYVRSETNHQSIIEYKGHDYFIYHNYYPEIGGDDFRRSVSIENLYYNADGSIRQIVQTTEGVNAVACNDIQVDCHGDVDGTAYLDDCDVCVGGNTGVEPCVGSVEGESACSVDGVLLESTNGGFFGEGYVNTDNTLGASVSWVLSSSIAQRASLTFRYANGGANARNGNIKINGQEVGSALFETTGAWTTWELFTINVELTAGTNELLIEATGAEGLANIDVIYFSEGVSTASCIITGLSDNQKTGIKLFPNPTQKVVSLTQETAWVLFNALGVNILEGHGAEIDLSNYNQGVYFVKINNELFKVIKE